MVLLGTAGVLHQLEAQSAHRSQVAHEVRALSLLAPATSSTSVSPTPTPPFTPAPTPAPRKTAPKVAYATKPLPPVAPAPNSNVSGLTPVAQNPAPQASSTPTPTPGQGSGEGSGTVAAPSYYYTSTNWSGYMSPAGHFTAVSGSWVVPTVTGAIGAADAAWVGIGGVTSGDLIQTGTDEFVGHGGQVQYEAFYELLPDVSQAVPTMTVHPGDHMSAEIHEVAGTAWQINLSDVTSGDNFSLNVTYTSSLSSAEWVEEAPSYASGGLIPLDNFGTVSFSAAQAKQSGVSKSMVDAGAQAIVMVDHAHHAVATPSAPGSDGASFRVTRN